MTNERRWTIKTFSFLSTLALAGCGGGGGGGGGNGGGSQPPATVAVTARGVAVGPITQQLVTASGATLVSADGRLTLDVPAGALLTNETISIQAIVNESPGGRGLGYRLLPEGLTFATPVTLTFKYNNADVSGSEPLALKIGYQDAQRRWNVIKNVTRDEVAKTVSVETDHFTDWSLLSGWQLLPPSASVAAGQSVDLVIVSCAHPETGDDELAELAYRCAPDSEFFNVEYWAANGIEGGSVADGMVSPRTTNTSSARYDAPNVAPPAPKNPVSVSAQSKDKTGRTTLLISHIWVDDHPPLSGTVAATYVQTIAALGETHTFTTLAFVTFKYDLTDQMYHPTSGNVVSHLDVVATECEFHVKFAGAIHPEDGAIIGNFSADGEYSAGAATSGLHVGTTTCTTNKTEQPLSLTMGASWWPSPSPAATPVPERLTVKSDGTLEETQTWSHGTETIVTVHWLLRPDPN